MSKPLYQLKAEFFKTLAHPARIRVLELLGEREHAVAELLPEVGIEPANLSQQLAVLRRAGLVVARKEGSTVHYSLTSPQVAELLAVARRILTVGAGRSGRVAGGPAGSPPSGDRVDGTTSLSCGHPALHPWRVPAPITVTS